MSNTTNQEIKAYSFSRKILHWLIALAVLGLFVSGFWMVELDYYSKWYTKIPHWHKSIGLLLIPVFLLAITWRRLGSKPAYEPGIKAWEATSAKVVQTLMSLLTFIVLVSGYMITTSNGDSVAVFNWFEVPSIISNIRVLGDIPGNLHRLLAYLLIALVILHTSAALYHHIVKKDDTLRKMLSK
jgi:cytochrome b561